jgi:hypothetical protein
MEKKRSVRVVGIICCVLFTTTLCFAETYYQKDKLFKIDVPDGWHWVERPGEVSIMNPIGINGVRIKFSPSDVISDKEARKAIKKGKESLKQQMVEQFSVTITNEKETQINDVYAYRLDYLLPSKGEVAEATMINFFNKGYFFGINFGSQIKSERLIMERIIETFQFLN